jgi:hypothetical protein
MFDAKFLKTLYGFGGVKEDRAAERTISGC